MFISPLCPAMAPCASRWGYSQISDSLLPIMCSNHTLPPTKWDMAAGLVLANEIWVKVACVTSRWMVLEPVCAWLHALSGEATDSIWDCGCSSAWVSKWLWWAELLSPSNRHVVGPKNNTPWPGQVAQLVGASSHAPKGYKFNRWSGHIFRLQVWPLVGACTGGKQ